MQIKIGQFTLEERALQWTRESTLVTPINSVASGGVVAIRETWKTLTQSISTKFNRTVDSTTWPGSRELGLKMERSQAVIKEQAKKARSKAKDVWQQWRQEDGGSQEESTSELYNE